MFESVAFQVHLEDDAVTDEAVDGRGMGTVVMEGIHWGIAGGESGPGAREIKAEWVRDLRDQCQIQRVAFFFKQWGRRTPKAGGNTLDGRQWLEYPEMERVRRSGTRLRAAGALVDNTRRILRVN